MTDLTVKLSIEKLEKIKPELVRKAKSSIDLANSFPVRGGDVVSKRGGGWFESIRDKQSINRKEVVN